MHIANSLNVVSSDIMYTIAHLSQTITETPIISAYFVNITVNMLSVVVLNKVEHDTLIITAIFIKHL